MKKEVYVRSNTDCDEYLRSIITDEMICANQPETVGVTFEVW